ncbi:hypothetical protein M885DRAFT_23905 [Pelagophyceae sp. CCMP2097]|nr:hypothetical protein M885DRAFT_23905 [Pelagophyceae sp. CCMP2097]
MSGESANVSIGGGASLGGSPRASLGGSKSQGRKLVDLRRSPCPLSPRGAASSPTQQSARRTRSMAAPTREPRPERASPSFLGLSSGSPYKGYRR